LGLRTSRSSTPELHISRRSMCSRRVGGCRLELVCTPPQPACAMVFLALLFPERSVHQQVDR
jgi:hypothetical protein